jgi:hypothetical protein
MHSLFQTNIIVPVIRGDCQDITAKQDIADNRFDHPAMLPATQVTPRQAHRSCRNPCLYLVPTDFRRPNGLEAPDITLCISNPDQRR